jgi:hypothetical protein
VPKIEDMEEHAAPSALGAGNGLALIAGEWTTTGHVITDPPVPVTGTDTYELLEGGHFLVHHVDVTVGDEPVRAIEIIGEPAPDGSGMLARSFDNHGNVEVMHLTIAGWLFHFRGGPDVARAAPRVGNASAWVRSTLTVAPGGDSMAAVWERSPDGTTWERWMDIDFTRRPAP